MIPTSFETPEPHFLPVLTEVDHWHPGFILLEGERVGAEVVTCPHCHNANLFVLEDKTSVHDCPVTGSLVAFINGKAISNITAYNYQEPRRRRTIPFPKNIQFPTDIKMIRG